MMVLMHVVLPAPFRPSRPSSWLPAQGEVDAIEHMAVAVIGMDAREGENLIRQD